MLKRSLTPSILLKSGFQVIFSSSFVTTLLRSGEQSSVSVLASDFLLEYSYLLLIGYSTFTGFYFSRWPCMPLLHQKEHSFENFQLLS